MDLKASRNYLGNAKEIENLPLLTKLDLHSNTINTVGLPVYNTSITLNTETLISALQCTCKQ